MKNLFEAATVKEVKERLAQLRPDSKRLWGTMDAAQAVFDTSARLGQPLALAGLADKAHGPSFAVPAGLVKWGARSHAAYSNAHQPATFGSTYQKTVRWLRDFF